MLCFGWIRGSRRKYQIKSANFLILLPIRTEISAALSQRPFGYQLFHKYPDDFRTITILHVQPAELLNYAPLLQYRNSVNQTESLHNPPYIDVSDLKQNHPSNYQALVLPPKNGQNSRVRLDFVAIKTGLGRLLQCTIRVVWSGRSEKWRRASPVDRRRFSNFAVGGSGRYFKFHQDRCPGTTELRWGFPHKLSLIHI